MEKLNLAEAELGVLARMVRQVEFFSPLTVGQLDEVLPHIGLFSFASGETVFKQGQTGDAFYIIYKGKVSVRVKKGFIFSTEVTTLGPGSFFGETALISSEPRNATIACTEPTNLFALVAGDFKFVLDQNPALKAEMKRIAERRKFETSHR